MYERLVPEALHAYGLTYTSIRPVQKGYRNEIYPVVLADGSVMQLTFYKSEDGIKERIERADAVSGFAAQHGLRARTRANTQTLVFRSEARTVYAGLYHYLPGETIAWEAYTKDHIKQLGKTLSDLHFSLRDFSATGQISIIDETVALVGRMHRYFTNDDVQQAMHDKLNLTLAQPVDRFAGLLEKTKALPSQQLHMDFVRGNVLFDDTKIVGILDFEKTAYGPVHFDVARTLAFLLVDCKYKTEPQVRRYFLQSGYTKRGAATLAYYPVMLEALVELFLIHDFYKFLRHNPYESLKDNQHFTRTVSILARSGVLHYA